MTAKQSRSRQAAIWRTAIAAALSLAALRAGGALLWQDRVDADTERYDAADVMVADHRAIVAGVVVKNPFYTSGDFLLRAYSLRGGRLLWEQRYNRGGGFDAATAVADVGGAIVAVGYSTSSSFDTDVVVRSVAPRDGSTLWEAVYDGGPSDIGWAVAGEDDTVYVAGQADAGGPMDFLVFALDASTGDMRWADRHDATGGDDRATAIAVGSGVVFAGGSSSLPGAASDALMRAYDADTGALLWQDGFGIAGGYDAINAVALGACAGAGAGGGAARPAGAAARPRTECLFVAGTTASGAGDSDFHVRSYEAATGALRWSDTYDPTGGYDSADHIALSGDLVVVAGTAMRPGRQDRWAVRAYDVATGALVWESTRQSRATGMDLRGMAIGPGRVFVAGSGVKKRYGDYLVRSYDVATGQLRWEDRFDVAHRDDRAHAIAFGSGRVASVGAGTLRNPRRSTMLVRTYDAR